jgi:transcriptional regulator with XRE-family HTH domain
MSQVIGKFIRARRKELGLSQSDVARTLGYNTSQYISNIERGLASLPFAKLQEISTLLKVDARHLLHLKLMEEVPDFREDLLRPAAGAQAGPPESGLVPVPVMSQAQCADWTDLSDLDFPRKISSRIEYARTEDTHAFYFQARIRGEQPLSGIRDGDLLLIEPSAPVPRGALALSVHGRDFRLGKVLPRNGEVILQPLDPNDEVEVLRRREVRVFRVAELKRRLAAG